MHPSAQFGPKVHNFLQHGYNSLHAQYKTATPSFSMNQLLLFCFSKGYGVQVTFFSANLIFFTMNLLHFCQFYGQNHMNIPFVQVLWQIICDVHYSILYIHDNFTFFFFFLLPGKNSPDDTTASVYFYRKNYTKDGKNQVELQAISKLFSLFSEWQFESFMKWLQSWVKCNLQIHVWKVISISQIEEECKVYKYKWTCMLSLFLCVHKKAIICIYT